jgi:DNA-binding IclR family transcriptional regulator
MTMYVDTAIDKALTILELLDSSRSGRSLADLSGASGLPKTTVHRLLGTLTERGFVDKTPGSGYRIGRKIIALGSAAAERDTLVMAARPVLLDLVEACGETAQLGAVMNRQLLFVDRIEPEEVAIRIGYMPSPLAELHTSAMGKAVLGASPDAFVRDYVSSGMYGYTEHTITGAEEMLNEIEVIRGRGYAESNEERYAGVYAVGSAILDRRATPIAAVSLAAPSNRVSDDKREVMAALVQRAAREISSLIAHTDSTERL